MCAILANGRRDDAGGCGWSGPGVRCCEGEGDEKGEEGGAHVGLL
jgi:hypothetical protein